MGRVGGQGSEATDGDGGLKMGSSGQEFVGGMGRVGGQGSAATDDGGKGTQCKNTKQNQRKKLNGSSLIKIFYTATETLSGSKYPTSHLYFFQLWNIKKVLNTEESVLNRKILNEEASSQDTTIAHMVEQMQTKFNLYWKEIYMSACIPVILDPRYKYDFLEYHLSDFGSEKEADTWMSEVKNTTQKLFNEYNQLISGEMQDCDIQEVQDVNDPLAEWDQYMKSKRRQSSNELDQYLKEKLTPRRDEIDILKWWKEKSEIYPVLSVMARDILAIPASTVPSESAFSTGGRVISDYRSSLAPTTIEALICLQDWFKAADAMENDD